MLRCKLAKLDSLLASVRQKVIAIFNNVWQFGVDIDGTGCCC